MADIVTNLPMKQFMEFHEAKGGYATVSMKIYRSLWQQNMETHY